MTPAPAAPSRYLRSAHDAGMVTKVIFASVGTMLLQAYEKISAVIPRLLECCDQFSDALKLTVDGQSSDGDRLDASKAPRQKAFEVFGRLMSGALSVCGTPTPPDALCDALNACLPCDDLRINELACVARDFDVTRDARWKRYRYALPGGA